MKTNSHPGPMVGRIAPDFTMPAVAGEEQPHTVCRDDYHGKWLILVFYPRDFSFVCPTELTAFSGRLADFRHRNCELLGVSVDSIELHQEWLQTPVDGGGLGPLQFPLASDGDGDVSRRYRVWVEEKRVSTRGLFVIDPQGILQYAVVHNLSVGRSPEEVLRVLDALRTGGLCPASWTTADGTLDVDNALKPGRILGHYRIRDTLGHGTFGTVFAAWDLHLERMVALKVLGRAGEAAHNVLLTEARAAAGLSHPNICTVYAVEEEDGLPLIAMEHLPGPALLEFISGKPSLSEVRRVASQIAAGLAAAHAREVVHGDLKPANIMLADEGAPKILDFGLARRLQQAVTEGPDNAENALRKATARGETDATAQESVATVVINSPETPGSSDGAISGTPAYMSPEQAFGKPVSPASDAFSFGLILYEMLTGSPAIREKRPMDAILRLRSEDFAETCPPAVPEEFRAVLSRLLQHHPELRPKLADVVPLLAQT